MLRKKISIPKITLLLAVFLLHLGMYFSTVPLSVSDSLVSTNRSTSRNYTIHDPIEVINDGQLAVVAINGTGTINDPYIIANWNISGSETDGISITGTTKYFRIEGCWIVNSTFSGINVDSIPQGKVTITNNTCTSNGEVGIFLRRSGYSTVANNTCNNNNDIGIHILYSPSSTVTNNTCNSNSIDGIRFSESISSTVATSICTGNGNRGIFLWLSGSSIVANNTCTSNSRNGISLGDGIGQDYSPFSTVANNTFTSNGGAGIDLRGGSGSTIVANNMFFDDGLVLSTSSKGEMFSCTIENNTVNDLPLGYFENFTDSTITRRYGQLILVNCNNTVVKNQNCSHTSIGIMLYFCDGNQLVNNTCNNNSEYGIYIKDSDSSTVDNNTCTSNDGTGIHLRGSFSSIVTINTCINNNLHGIYFLSSNSSTLAKNTCNNNYKDGISLRDFDLSVVDHNTCANNVENGISLGYSDHNSIVWNMLVGNGDYGIVLLDYSNTNFIHHNSFLANGQNSSQAYDDGSNNQWYDDTLLEGNSWSDYSGSGSYLIAGSSGSSDPYPSIPSVTDNNAFISLLFRIGLFVFVCGILCIIFLVNRHKKSV